MLKNVVEQIYGAFGRGDIATITQQLAGDVEWEYGAGDHGIPWLKPLRGANEVPKFFMTLGEQLEFLKFEPKTILEGPGIVVVLVELEARVRKTGRVIRETDEVHIWRFDAANKVRQFKHAVDTHQHLMALRG